MDERFTQASGTHVYTGCELLVKGALESGVSLITGYPGSPLAEVFDTLQRNAELLKTNGIVAQIANNEALSIARLNGSQMADIRAIAFMKSVGFHVATDALAISNLAGTSRGAVVVVGDDTWSHSTQVPADSRFLARHVHTPLIEPTTFQELKDWIHVAFQISEKANLYVSLLTTENQASGGGNVELRPNIYPDISTLKQINLETHLIDADKRVVLPPHTAQIEVEALRKRIPTALEIARELGLNTIQFGNKKKHRLGFVSTGLAHSCLRHALGELGMAGEIPILKLGMTYPIDKEIVREFAAQVDEIYVVEEKRPLLENEIKAFITEAYQNGDIETYRNVWGKQFPNGLSGIPETSGLDASILIEKLIPLLKHKLGSGEKSAHTAQIDPEHLAREEALQTQVREQQIDIPQRTPTFCPGCPHRDSSSVLLEITDQFMDADYMRKHHDSGPVDLVFHGDIGCYSMLKYEPFPRLMHNLSAMALGGGAGAGIDPFIKNKQVVFMGDSTFFHGGITAISDSIKNDQDITYIILDNQTTAMTGHQPTPAGEIDLLGNPTFAQDIEQVAQGLAGTADIEIVRTNPEDRVTYKKYLERTFLKSGVKIVIADKECAITYHRRIRRDQRKTIAKDGFLKSEKHINITPEVCEFCRECTTATGCPGLKIIDTDYGEKIAIDQSNCVTDGACARIKYACPAFEEVIVTRKRPPKTETASGIGDLLSDDPLPPPPLPTFDQTWNMYAAGVGGMGIGTISKVLVVAGYLQGYDVTFCDRKGLAIRNGGVYTHITYMQPGVHVSPMIPYGKADLLLGLDVLEAVRGITAHSIFRIASPDRTAALVNTAKTETISTLIGKDNFDPDTLENALQTYTNADAYFGTDLFTVSEELFGNKLYANMMLLGAAFQRQLIPIELEPLQLALKQMVPLADLETNMKAFTVGRRLALGETQPLQSRIAGEVPLSTYAEMLAAKQQLLKKKRGGKRLSQDYTTLVESTVETLDLDSDALHRRLALYIYDLVQFENITYAQRYVDKIKQVRANDSNEQNYRATKAAIRYLHKVMLIKDEVYVAHLLTSEEKLERDKTLYKVDPANGDKIKYVHLNRPHFTVMGIEFEGDIDTRNWQLHLMKRMKFLRRLLPDWHAREKAFREWYITDVIDTFSPTDAETYEKHLRALACVEEVRGYREIRYPKMEAAKEQVHHLLQG